MPTTTAVSPGRTPTRRTACTATERVFEQSGALEAQSVGEPVEDASGDGDVIGKGTVAAVLLAGHPEHAPLVAQVELTLAAEMAPAARHGRVEGDPIAFSPAFDLGADHGHDTGRFMAHDDGRAAAPGAPVHPMDVTAANTARPHGDEDLVVGQLSNGDVRVVEVAGAGEDQGFHL